MVCSPPRVKHKPVPKQAGKNLKRHVSESDDDEENNVGSGDSGLKEKRHGKQWHMEGLESEVSESMEIINVPIEEVNNVRAEESDNEVSAGLNLQ